jgi:hypothetical protein
MSDLTQRIRSEANIADRPGQLDRLNRIADEVDDALMATARLVEDQRDRIEALLLSLRICAEERRELAALREDRADLRAKVEALRDEAYRTSAWNDLDVGQLTAYRKVLALFDGPTGVNPADPVFGHDHGQ